MFAKQCDDVDLNMVYTVAAYNDIECHIDRKNDEIVFGQLSSEDENLKAFFSGKEIFTEMCLKTNDIKVI